MGGMAFVATLPVLTLIVGAILVDSGWPPFFSDERVGAGGRPFRILKFRTMTKGAKTMALGIQVSRDDARITRVGRMLRRWSLDELPQLVNVIRGDMSIVGPRPTYASQVERYSEAHRARLAVRPGITGLAQISGRNDLNWADRIALDLQYIRRMSPQLDLEIIARTPFVVLRGAGLYGREGITPDYDPGA